MKPCNIQNKKTLKEQLEVYGATVTEANNMLMAKFASNKHADSAYEVINNQFPDASSLSGSTVTIPVSEIDLQNLQKIQKPVEVHMYQLHPDNKQRNSTLEKAIKNILSDQNIRVVSLEEYKRNYNVRTDIPIDAVAIADIAQKVIAYNKDLISGTTLPEEAGHFIENALMQQDENNWRKLMNARNDKGILYISETDMWKKHYETYLEKYNQDAFKAKREIVGKLFGQVIQEKFNERNINGTVQRFIKRALDKIKKWLRGKDQNAIPDAVKEIYEGAVENFFEGTLNVNVKGEAFDASTSQTRIQKITNTALNTLKFRQTKLKQEKNRLNNKLKKKYKKLKSIHDIEALDDSIDTLSSKVEKTEDDIKVLKELYDLKKLDAISEKDKRDLDAIKKLEDQIYTLEQQILKKQEGLALETLISGIEDTKGKRSGGLKEDIIGIVRDLSLIRNGEMELTPIIYQEMLEFADYYLPTVERLQGYYNRFKKIDNVNNKLLKRDLRKVSQMVNEVRLFLNEYRNEQVAELLDIINRDELGKKIDQNFDADQVVQDGALTDMHSITRTLGAAQHIDDPYIQSALKIISDIQNDVYNSTYEYGKKILSEIDFGKDHSYVLEKDNGKPTGYALNRYKIGGDNGFIAAEERAYQEIFDATEKFARSKNINLHFPRGRNEGKLRKSILVGNDIIASDMSETAKLNALKERKEISKFYNDKIARWSRTGRQTINIDNAENLIKELDTYNNILAERKLKVKNGVPKKYLPPWPVEYVKAVRMSQLSEVEYREWKKLNIRSFSKGEYYVGELSVPSDNFLNPDFQNLSEEQKKVRNFYVSELTAQKNKLPSFYSTNYAERLAVPQISESALDLVIGSKKSLRDWKGLKDRALDIISGVIIKKEDDELYAHNFEAKRADGSDYKTAPIRFKSKLNNPDTLSRDVFSSLIAYHEMAENFERTNQRIHELEFLKKGVRNTKFKKHRFQLLEGSESNTAKLFDDLLQVFIYKEDTKRRTTKLFGREVDWNKVSNFLASWVRRKNLQGNVPAALTGFLQAQKESILESLLERYTTKESKYFAAKELFSNSIAIMQEIGAPIKTSKVGQFIDKIGLDSNRERFDNLDKNRIIRSLNRSFDFGMWRTLDFMPKAEGFIAIADNYRKIDGIWHTKESYKGDDWSEHREKSFYSLLDNNMESPEIGPEQWRVVRQKARRFASHLDTQPMDIDRAMLVKHPIGQFLGIHRGWMAQGVQRRLKAKHFNRYTGVNEQGYYRSVIDSVRTLFFSDEILYDTKGKLSRWDRLSPVEKEGLLRSIADLFYAYAAYLFAFMINAALDDEDDPLAQLAAYVSTRLVLENMAFFSLREMIDLIQRPVAGVDLIDNISDMFNGLMELIFFWDEVETVSRGPYKGKTQFEKAVIKSTPIVKGVYETFPVETPYTSPTKGNKSKNRYIKNQVIGESSIFDPFLFPVQAAVGQLKDANDQ
jgi:hypothetical protein